MILVCGGVIRKMLRKFEMEEEDGRIFVVCLDELKKKKEGR